MAKVKYNGVDITSEVAMISCIHEMHAWGALDSLTVRFASDDGKWRRWGAALGDTIEVSDGAASTGEMRVIEASPDATGMRIRALAAPREMLVSRVRSWERAGLYQIIEQVARECGLACEMHGVDDRVYGYVEQSGEDDARFLAARLKLEGACMAIHGRRLVAYGERWVEEREQASRISVGFGDKCSLKASAKVPYGACRVTTSSVEGVYRALDGPVLDLRLPIAVTDSGEAVRFARNLLRASKREERMAILKTEGMLAGIAPGSAVDLEVAGSREWSGRAVVAHQRNDYVAATSKVWFAMALGDI